MRWPGTRLALLALTLLSAFALAACGGGGGSASTDVATTSASTEADGGGVLARAGTRATEAGSLRVSFTLTTEVPGQDAPIVVTGDGAFDSVDQRGSFTYDFSDLFAASGIEGGEDIEVILDGSTYYVKYPLLASLLPGAKPWIRFTLEDLAKQQAVDLSSLKQLNQADPTATLSYLKASGSIEEVGPETIDGVETTHYRGTIDLDKVAGQAPAESRAQVQETIDQLKKQTGLEELPVEVWIDGEGLPRQLEYTYEIDLAASGAGTGISKSVFAMLFSDYGLDVTVEPPAASETSDLSTLLG